MTEDTFKSIFLSRVISHIGDARRLVLLLDEFDVIDERKTGPIAAANFIPFLGHLIASGLNFGAVLVLGRRTSELSERFNASLLKDSVQMRIGRLDAAQTAEMISTLAGSHLTFSEPAVDRIIGLAAGHPYCTQVLCYAIWSRCSGRLLEISVGDVDAAVPDAIELGANGMTWIYDGLELAEQRLFLSTLSETVDPLTSLKSSLDSIQSFLRDHRLSLGQADLDSAARDLSAWDVIIGTNDTGYRFAVPLLGAWVRRERPVFQLEQEVRFVNPRAWSFYELALESEQRGELDAAILDYRTLQANPVFIEAQRRLATVLHRRGRRGDLLAAIEAWERVLELDPSSPRAELMDSLLLALETTQNTSRAQWLFQKIENADNVGLTRDRAIRNIQERAARKMAIGSKSALPVASDLFKLIGDSENAAKADAIRKKQERFTNASMLTFFLSSGLAIGFGFIPLVPQMPDLRIALAGLGGLAIFWDDIFQKSPRFTLTKIGLPFLVLAMVIGEIIWRFTGALGFAGFGAFFAAVIGNATQAPTFPQDPDEDLLAPEEVSGGPLFRIMDTIAHRTARIRDRLARSPHEIKDEKT